MQSVLRRHLKREGVLRAVQPRAVATRDALLASGRKLLVKRDFDSLSVAELAEVNGLSVGSFYGRFRDKESYFALLRETVTAEWLEDMDRQFAIARKSAPDARGLVEMVAGLIVGIFRRDRGFMLASIRHAASRPVGWTPVKRAGAEFVDRFTREIVPRLDHLRPADAEHRVRFSMQVMYGTLVNAVINDPGPIPLADKRFERELARMMAAYLELR